MKSLLLFTCSILLVATATSSFETQDLQTLFEWKYLNVKFDSAEEEAAANKNNYKENTIIFDTDVRREPNGRETYFVTAIGSAPVSLLVVTDEENENGRLLKPFPSSNWAKLEKYGCGHTIVGAYRVAVDHCGRVWVVDTGMRGDDKLCPPKLVVFGADNKTIINQEIPKNILTTSTYSNESKQFSPVSLPVNIKLQFDNKQCQDLTKEGGKSVKAFIADVDGYSLIWWQNGFFRRLEAKEFQADKKANNYTINGLSFELADGILGIALGKGDDANKLYGSSLSSYNIFSMNVNWFDSGRSNCLRPLYISKALGSIKAHKAPIVYAGGRLCFVLLEKQSLVCWDPNTPFTENNLKYLDTTDKFNFVSGFKTKNRPWDGLIGPLFPWSTIYGCTDFILTSNTYQKLANGVFNTKEINFRVFKKHCAAREPWDGYDY